MIRALLLATVAASGCTVIEESFQTNAFSGDKGFYRLLSQKPGNLLLPQSTAFAILGYSCGGIQEHPYVTGFDPTTGYPTGDVYLSTTCNGSGRSNVLCYRRVRRHYL